MRRKDLNITQWENPLASAQHFPFQLPTAAYAVPPPPTAPAEHPSSALVTSDAPYAQNTDRDITATINSTALDDSYAKPPPSTATRLRSNTSSKTMQDLHVEDFARLLLLVIFLATAAMMALVTSAASTVVLLSVSHNGILTGAYDGWVAVAMTFSVSMSSAVVDAWYYCFYINIFVLQTINI